MKTSKLSLIFLILNIIITPLLGRYNLFGIEILNKLIYFGLPLLYFISFIIDAIKSNNLKQCFKPNILLVLISIYIIILTISIFLGIDINFNTITNYIFFTYLVGFIYTLYIYQFTENQLKTILKSIIIVFTIVSTLGILQYIFKFDLIIRGIYKYPGAIGRISSTMSISTILDKYLTLNLLLLMYILYKLKKFNWKLSLLALIGTISLAFTFSRTGTLCFYIIAILFIILYLYKKQYLNLLITIILVLTLYLIPGQNHLLSSTATYANDKICDILEKVNLDFFVPIVDKIANIFIIGEPIEDDASLDSRSIYMKIAKQIVIEYPLTGIGIGNYNYLYKYQNVNDYLENDIQFEGEYLYPHNMYYHHAAEIGIIGLISLFSILIFILIKTIKNKNYIAILFFITFLLMNTTESMFYMKDIAIWFIITFTLFTKIKDFRLN